MYSKVFDHVTTKEGVTAVDIEGICSIENVNFQDTGVALALTLIASHYRQCGKL